MVSARTHGHLAQGVGAQVDARELEELLGRPRVHVGELKVAAAKAALAPKPLGHGVKAHKLQCLAVGSAHLVQELAGRYPRLRDVHVFLVHLSQRARSENKRREKCEWIDALWSIRNQSKGRRKVARGIIEMMKEVKIRCTPRQRREQASLECKSV